MHRAAGRRAIDDDDPEPFGGKTGHDQRETRAGIRDGARAGGRQRREADARPLAEHGRREARAKPGGILVEPFDQRGERAGCCRGGPRGLDLPLDMRVSYDRANTIDLAVRRRLSGTRSAELKKCLAKRAFAIGMRGLAARRHLQRRRGFPEIVADDVEIADPELGRGKLDRDLDPIGGKSIEQGTDFVVLDGVELDRDALIERAITDDVPVALQELHDAMPDRIVEIETGAEPVGDRRDQVGRVSELIWMGRHPVGRQEHAFAGRPAHAFHPRDLAVGVVAAARLETERQGIDGDIGTAQAHELAVALDDLRHAGDMLAAQRFLAKLAECADTGFLGREPVAMAGDHRLARNGQIGLRDRNAGPVERVDPEDRHARIGQRRPEGCRDVAEGLGHATLRRLSWSTGKCLTAGGPAMPSSRTAVAIAVSIPGAYSNGVHTVSKPRRPMTSR